MVKLHSVSLVSTMANPLGWIAEIISDFGKMFALIAGDIFGTITTNQLKEILRDIGNEEPDEELDETIRSMLPNCGTIDFLQFLTFLGRYFDLSPAISDIINDLGNTYTYVRASELKKTIANMKQNLPYLREGLDDLINELSSVVDEFPVTTQLLRSIMEQKWFII